MNKMNKLKLLKIMGFVQVLAGLCLLITEIAAWFTNRNHFQAILFIVGLVLLFGGLDALKRYARLSLARRTPPPSLKPQQAPPPRQNRTRRR